jgi:hypothetical protein
MTSKLKVTQKRIRLRRLTPSYLLKLASNVGKLFESSEAHEKRLLLKMILQNLELKGKKSPI